MTFHVTKHGFANHDPVPESFLTELVQWGRGADESVFAPNPNPEDIYGIIKPELGPWMTPLSRRAAMLEAMRIHAGFESDWNFNEGVDTENQTSMHNIVGQETGLFQVSFNSVYLGDDALLSYASIHGIWTAEEFIAKMKSDHRLAFDYYARLVRVSVRWAGPLLHRKINQYLSRAAMAEFEALLP